MKKILIIIAMLGVFMSFDVFAQNSESAQSIYIDYMNNPILDYPLEQAQSELKTNFKESNLKDREYTIKKGLLFFRVALLTYGKDEGESVAEEAFNYWETSHKEDKTYQNPVHLAYLGTLESMYGGAITGPQPVKKTNLAKNGMEKLDEAVAQIKKTGDLLATSYVYFLQGTTYAYLPEFFKEFNYAPTSLKKSISFYSKTRKTKIYSNDLILFLVSYSYYSYGNYYLKSGNIKKAIKYFNGANKYLSDLEPTTLKKNIEQKLAGL